MMGSQIMTRRRHLIAVLAAGFLALTCARASATTDDNVQNFINTLSNRAIQEMTAQQTDAERAGKLRPVLDEYFDMPAISKYVLAGYWRKATEAQRTEFTSAFADYLSVTYGKRFSKYSGHKMDIKRIHDDGNGRATAYTVVQVAGEDPVRVDWIIDTVNSQMHILDLRVEGLSLSDTHRQEFASVMQNNGGNVQALIDLLHQKSKLQASTQ